MDHSFGLIYKLAKKELNQYFQLKTIHPDISLIIICLLFAKKIRILWVPAAFDVLFMKNNLEQHFSFMLPVEQRWLMAGKFE